MSELRPPNFQNPNPGQPSNWTSRNIRSAVDGIHYCTLGPEGFHWIGCALEIQNAYQHALMSHAREQMLLGLGHEYSVMGQANERMLMGPAHDTAHVAHGTYGTFVCQSHYPGTPKIHPATGHPQKFAVRLTE